MRRTTVLMIAGLCTVLLLVGTAAHAQQVKGTVINRDGVARSACQVSFAGPATYSVWTNSEGAFFLEGPRYGDYVVTVKLGGQSQTFKITVNQYGLNPSTLVVDW
jgi:hypothetical protein